MSNFCHDEYTTLKSPHQNGNHQCCTIPTKNEYSTIEISAPRIWNNQTHDCPITDDYLSHRHENIGNQYHPTCLSLQERF